MKLIKYFNKIRELYFGYEKILLPVSFFIGLFWDNLTLRRVDMPYENSVFIWNLFQAAAIIFLLNIFKAGRLKGKLTDRIIPFLPMFLQFSFGNIFSGFIVFYIRSGSIFASWPFMLILAILFVGNEFFRKRYSHLPFQAGVLFTAVFSYFVFALPVLINKMGDLVFLASGGLAFIFMTVLILSLFFESKDFFRKDLKYVFATIASTYLVFNILYFANMIPPIPLMLKEITISHSIELQKQGNYIYKLAVEPGEDNFPFFKKQSNIFHLTESDAIYAYSAIFSPADLNVEIFHRWIYFSETAGKWIEVAKSSFNITGGRASGYRGYSYILGAVSGKWRVDTMTETGQILGRQEFTVVESNSIPVIETVLR
jgi:hypothetical protein